MFSLRGFTDGPKTTLAALALLCLTFLLYTKTFDLATMLPLLDKLGGGEALLTGTGAALLALYRGTKPPRRPRRG